MNQFGKVLLSLCLLSCLGLSGCGGAEDPPPLSDDLRQEIEQEDKQIADGESAL
jgi:hypothetical protein